MLLGTFRNESQTMSERQTGTVKWFNVEKGYGFITLKDSSTDIFVHHTGIDQTGFRRLEEGQAVAFNVIDHERGPIAQKVTPLT